MKNLLPLPALGFMLCFCFPVIMFTNAFDSPSSAGASIVWSIVALHCFFLCFLLAFLWMVFNRHYGWQTIDEKDRTDFLTREDKSVNKKWKFRVTMLLFMLLVSDLVAILFYIAQSFWKPLAPSFASFMSANSVVSVFTAIAALVWLGLCDRKLRATRVAE